MTTFRRIMPADLDFLGSQSIDYLDYAAKSINDYHGVEQAFAQVKSGIGHIYQVFRDNELIGCFFLNFIHNHLGYVMNMILLGGRELTTWSEDLTKFLWKLADDEKADEFCYLGRDGFKKIFPHLEKVAVLYRVTR